MAKESKQFFDWLCRTCMQELARTPTCDATTPTDQQWQCIFDRNEECGTLPIAELLANAIPQLMEAQQSDELPKKICGSCLQQLLTVYRFQQMCTQSDQHMRLLIAANMATTTKSPVASEKDANDFTKSEFIWEENKNIPEFEPANTLTDIPIGDLAADPLQTIEVVMEDCKDEPNDENDTHSVNNEYSDDEALQTTAFETDTTVLKVETEESQKKLTLVCDICGKTFCKPSSLRTHTRKYHSTENTKTSARKQLTCELCNETCTTRSKLAKHKKLQHSTEKQQEVINKHPCDQCHKSFKSKKLLKSHQLTHNSDKPFLCPECGQAFRQLCNMRQHMLRHGEKIFECPYCPAKFRCPTDVSIHKTIHEGIKRHICDICGFKFRRSDQLTMHKRLHSNIKPYKCDFCEMRFYEMTAQRRHMRIHTGEKPHKCKFCGRAFIQNNELAKHLRTHLGDNIYSCKLCPLRFRLVAEMRLHFATHKNEDAETRERNMRALEEEEAKLQLKFAVSAQ